MIKESKVFLCSHDINHHQSNAPQLFCIIKSGREVYQKLNLACDDDQGIYKEGQWFTNVSLEQANTDVGSCQVSANEFHNFTNVLGIPLLQNDSMNTQLYAFVSETWLCRSCNGVMCVPKIASELIIELNEI